MSRRKKSVIDGNAIPDHERSYTRQQFCLAENISLPTYYNWQRIGLGPEEICINGIFRITAQQRERWHRKMEKNATSKQVKIARARRQRINATAAMISARGPRHISKQRQASQ